MFGLWKCHFRRRKETEKEKKKKKKVCNPIGDPVGGRDAPIKVHWHPGITGPQTEKETDCYILIGSCSPVWFGFLLPSFQCYYWEWWLHFTCYRVCGLCVCSLCCGIAAGFVQELTGLPLFVYCRWKLVKHIKKCVFTRVWF